MADIQKQREHLRAKAATLQEKIKKLDNAEAAFQKALVLSEKKKKRKERNHKLYRFAAKFNSLSGNAITQTTLEEMDELAEITWRLVHLALIINDDTNYPIMSTVDSSSKFYKMAFKIIEKLKEDVTK